MKKFTFSLLLLYLFIPLSVFAYSDYIIASGESIGIELKADHVLIVGSYDIGTHNILKDTDLKKEADKRNQQLLNDYPEIVSKIFDSKMIDLNNMVIETKVENGRLFIQYYDTNILENVIEYQSDKTIKLNKKTKLFV